MKKLILLTLTLVLCLSVFSQKNKKKDKLTAEESKELLSQFTDSAKMVAQFSANACRCIDSISLTNRGGQEISDDIYNCIDKQVDAYQMSDKLFKTLLSPGNNKIEINTNRESMEYHRYYFALETWLKDSCESLNRAVASHNKESDYSMSKDPKALKEYDEGVTYMQAGDFKNAAVYFTKAVKADAKFAFAWDNLGISHRKLGNLDEALEAYNKSLELDPKGITPLHNIPVVYEFQKKYDQAIEAYQNILKFYPGDPEAYYGEGRIYAYFKIDMEKALQNMCKAYNIYTNSNSPYRVDAEKNINYIYSKMKEEGKEARFYEILKENKISTGK